MSNPKEWIYFFPVNKKYTVLNDVYMADNKKRGPRRSP
uniref:Uncharacterized protein n=1 Tax=Arundo donax TaxID=35708 RepID=A0A0A9H277_ARUDO